MKTGELQGNGEAGFSPAPERGSATKGIRGWPDPEVTGRPVMRHFSAAYKRRMVEEAARCQPGELGAMLRREGLYSSALTRWRKQYAAGGLAGLSAKAPVTSPGRRVLWQLTWHGWSGRTGGFNGGSRRPN